jgi:hypothetical protein
VTRLELRTETLKERADAHDEGREAIAEKLAVIRESVTVVRRRTMDDRSS